MPHTMCNGVTPCPETTLGRNLVGAASKAAPQEAESWRKPYVEMRCRHRLRTRPRDRRAGRSRQKNVCEAIVAERLDRLNVDPSDIRKIHHMAAHAANRESARKTGYEAWVSLRSCKGNLVVKMSLRCKIRDVYGHGDCELGD